MADNKIKKIEEYVNKRLTFLAKYGFSRVLIARSAWSTVISCLSDKMAIEIELDWRELDVFVLVTALSNGKLPNGYYVSEGKPCRIHIEKVLTVGCNINYDDIRKLIKKQPARSERDELTMKTHIDSYMQLIEQYIPVIQKCSIHLFE